ncbi:N-6 DNA methylase [Nannocystis sp. ILAH1]|uniref:HsdM family class I SAM-dependent methyltransferase n=1 Tax=Nannocystis sp. ILAH1 TaxID=2996789 RepID=UPI00226F4428|nr:N-6 DNA methylase [Nannocystis sp. ILAH1]MCY0985779.1 N-6 DNA methylase [Nannocystis sp. ILAH1]
MPGPQHWLQVLTPHAAPSIDGLVSLAGDAWRQAGPGQYEVLERARHYGADFVFFRELSGRPPVAQALVYVEDRLTDEAFAELHRRLWNWGAVPLVYRKRGARVDLLRCAHAPDFLGKDGRLRYHAFSTLDLLTSIDSATDVAAWWDSELLYEGSLWDDPTVCEQLCSADKSAHQSLIQAIKQLDEDLHEQRNLLPQPLRRRLLVLSLLISYLEDRKILQAAVFERHRPGATRFFEVLEDGPALVSLLAELEQRFNGDVFLLSPDERDRLLSGKSLGRFATFVGGRTAPSGQMALWRLYSFSDLPVELISHVYELFVVDRSAVYTPPFLVRMLVEEVLDAPRLDRLFARKEVVLDPACGSGVFLVEAYKRLVSHWRSRNDWRRPDIATLRSLALLIRGIDINPDAIELAAFSLCLALCEALDVETIQRSAKLFPKLQGRSLHVGCFFDARDNLRTANVGVILGNPPFQSDLGTPGAALSCRSFVAEHGNLPDKQLAYLFLHDCLPLLQPGGVLCVLQPYGLLYNEGTVALRRSLFEGWDVREVLDMISIRGIFGRADTKVFALVAEAQPPPQDRQILHAVFRRTGSVSAQRGFDIDYYDLHWLPRQAVLADPAIWRANLLGGGRVRDFVDRLRRMRTLANFLADQEGWDYGEGFIAGGSGATEPAEHISGKPVLPSEALTTNGIDETAIFTWDDRPIERPRTRARFTAPMLLIREHIDLPNTLRRTGYLTYRHQILGICAPKSQLPRLERVKRWLDSERRVLQAYALATSRKAMTQKATTLTAADITDLPFPDSGDLQISPNEQLVADDIVDFYSDFIRLGEDSPLLARGAEDGLPGFCTVYTRQINSIYANLRPCPAYRWPGVVCQPFVFGDGMVDWSGVEELRVRLRKLLEQRRAGGLTLHRISRVFDGPFVFLLKPDRLRYWLRSIALRDADETLADLRAQGF